MPCWACGSAWRQWTNDDPSLQVAQFFKANLLLVFDCFLKLPDLCFWQQQFARETGAARLAKPMDPTVNRRFALRTFKAHENVTCPNFDYATAGSLIPGRKFSIPLVISRSFTATDFRSYDRRFVDPTASLKND
jgi:hypothetical protein